MNKLTEYLETFYDEIEPKDFYRIIFPKGELDAKDAKTKGKYTGIIVEVMPETKRVKKEYSDGTFKMVDVPVVHRHTITDDLDKVDEVLKRGNFCLTPPLSYAGKKRSSANARYAYAIAIDLDEIRIGKDAEGKSVPIGLIDMIEVHVKTLNRIPMPSMIVSSGTGLHLYFVFNRPVPLFPKVAAQLQKLKHELTQLCWNEGIVDIKSDEDIQYEGIYQGFRMPGTITKEGKQNGTGERARAFWTGEKISLEELNDYVSEKNRVTAINYTSALSKTQAKELYPDWYDRKIEKGEKKPKAWHVNRAVYDWWIEQIKAGAKVRHRYWCLWILAVYAKKCSYYDPKKNPNPVTLEELERDAWELFPMLEKLTVSEDNHFTNEDVTEALEAFEEDYITYPKNSIRYKSQIVFEPQVKRREKGKRLKQREHLEEARAVRDVRMKRLGKNWQNGNGRPAGSKNKSSRKKDDILEYYKNHQGASVTEIAKALDVSRPTVYKYIREQNYKMEKDYKFDVDYIVTDSETGNEILIETVRKTDDREELRKRLAAYLSRMTKPEELENAQQDEPDEK